MCRWNLAALFATSGWLVFFSHPLEAQNIHFGVTRERGGDPVAAYAQAYSGDQEAAGNGECPQYGDLLDAADTNASTGEFEVKIAPERRQFRMVYCANGYHARSDRQRNEKDRVDLKPKPAELRKQSTNENSEADRVIREIDTINMIILALNELSYLQRVNPETFSVAVEVYVSELNKDVGEDVGAAVRELIPIVETWGR